MTSDPRAGCAEMVALVADLPGQLERSAGLAGLETVTAPAGGCGRPLFCGMGGSAIAADLIAPALAGHGHSLAVRRDYGLPEWVGPGDLVIAASYSGETEETLSAVSAARERGCPLVGVTSGGTLAAWGADPRSGFPVVRLPGGLPPRASLGYGLGALAGILENLGLLPGGRAAVATAAARLHETGGPRLAPWGQDPAAALPDDPDGNPAVRAVARDLVGRLPVLFTAGAAAHPAGLRLKAQLNENAKVPACLAAFPELDHNELVGWALPADLRDRFVLLILRDRDLDPRTERRVAETRRLLADEFPLSHEIRAGEGDALGRVLSLVQYGDCLSCHLAELTGIDPVPVERIRRLKEALAR